MEKNSLNKAMIPLVLFFFSLSLTTLLTNGIQQPTYLDRGFWEKTGVVVWEARVREKAVALTFDDGPSPTFTPLILNILSQNHAQGTFFVVGKLAEKYPEIVLRESQEGHEIGNHCYEHREISDLTADELKKDLQRTHEAVYQIQKKEIRLFRPTSGFYDKKVVRVAQMLNYTVIIWTWGLDSRDWSGINGNIIAKRVLQCVRPGSIILFHDQGGNRRNTLQALQILLPILQMQGYRLVTVSQLLKISQGAKFSNTGSGNQGIN